MKQRLIRSKREFNELAAKGLCGNTPLTWYSADEFLSSADDEFITLRSYEKADPRCRCHMPRQELKSEIKNLGFKEDEYYLSQTYDNTKETRLNAELTWVNGDWYMHYSLAPTVMREGLAKHGRHAFGYSATSILHQYTDANSLRDIHNLFDIYSPNHQYPTIELTVTRSYFGIYPRRNTLIWEVRHY